MAVVRQPSYSTEWIPKLIFRLHIFIKILCQRFHLQMVNTVSGKTITASDAGSTIALSGNVTINLGSAAPMKLNKIAAGLSSNDGAWPLNCSRNFKFKR